MTYATPDQAAAAADHAARVYDNTMHNVLLGFSVGPAALIYSDTGLVSVARMVSEQLCDVPGNPLHDLVSYIGKRAKTDPEALAIVNKLAETHAEWMASKAEDE